ncbi:DUF2179 domain-containing protein [Desulfosporosinus sp. BICA1-9]|uniref:DUF2179 domain-containing protein n=1 Tax=Desulfosporosinus sp. BICA1-9 TaxID=1531958 RepID=UPI00054C17F8|nr:DUF2179 domain-containing protein [Desulfosporosinus sp. BICA1-9]KJS46174.1 MAG: hypothetical protein VR66_26910 [Peptococcaceae bacterium BRH_c23]KJS90087.1 MAG: hypothetical protein JL57_03880 [Desulfosporosinus sp. BICA1-9]
MEDIMKLILIIIGINVVYVSMCTLRMIFVIKGQRILASILSVVEIFVYMMGLRIVLKNLDNYWNLAAYCIGYGLGVYIGSRIEEYIALGYVTVQVTVDCVETEIPSKLREYGYGVTSWLADGKDGPRLMMQVLAKRSNERQLIDILDKLCPKAFVVSYEPKNFKGGFWIKRMPKSF